MSPHLALQLYKAFISSKPEFGCTVWSFRINNAKHLKLILESAQRGATSLILKRMKSTPADALESDINTSYWSKCWGTQQYEAVKMLINKDDYIQFNIIEKNQVHKMGSPFENLRYLTKHLAILILSKTKKCNVN